MRPTLRPCRVIIMCTRLVFIKLFFFLLILCVFCLHKTIKLDEFAIANMKYFKNQQQNWQLNLCRYARAFMIKLELEA